MHIKLSSVAGSETIVPLNNFYVALQDALNARFSTESFGKLDWFMVVIVAVYDEADRNKRFCDQHNKSGSFADPVTKQRESYMSVAVEIAANKVISLSETELRAELCDRIGAELSRTSVKVSKGFEFTRFVDEMKTALEIYKVAH